MHDRNDPAPQGLHLRLEIVRPRVVDALARLDRAPVHILCAPPGSGKTTALLQYAAQQPDVRVLTLPARASRTQVLALLTSLRGAPLTVIDRADAASPAGHHVLLERIEEDWRHGRRYLLGVTSRTAMRMQPLLARGIAAMADAAVLSFDFADIESLARAHAVAADAMDIEQLRYDTDGWPLAVAWLLRDVARSGRALRGAFAEWRAQNGHLLLECVTDADERADAKEAFVSALWSLGDPASQRSLDRLEAAGYPIIRMRTGLRPYRLLVPIATDLPVGVVAEAYGRRLVLTLFGRFSCRIADQPVGFVRRRDRNVLAYIALAPDATVTRAELLATFWPDASRAVASQGLRTTLYRLRHAVADAAGCDAGRYLRIDDSVGLELDWVSIDARTFRRCVELGVAEEAVGDRGAARDHYLQAERLYTDSLLASEGVEPMLRAAAAEYEHLANEVLTHLVAIYARDGDAKLHRAFAARRAALDYERRRSPAPGEASSRWSPIMTSI